MLSLNNIQNKLDNLEFAIIQSEIQQNIATRKEIIKRLETKNITSDKYCEKHSCCRYLSNKNIKHSAAIFLTKDHPILGKIFLLGKERAGNYKNKYNFCAGGGEATDINSIGQLCWVACLLRELNEEFKINIKSVEEFNKMFVNNDGKINVMIHNKTPIFFGKLFDKTRTEINKKIRAYNKFEKIGWCYREMANVDFFRLDNGKQTEGKQVESSLFVLQVYAKKNEFPIY